MEERTECIHVAAGELDAQQVRACLEANGVPCEFKGEALRNTHGLTLNGLGEVRIHVAREHVEQARDILAQVESGALSLDEGQLPPDDSSSGVP